MQIVLGLAMLAAVLMGIKDWHGANGTYDRPSRTVVRGSAMRAAAPTPVMPQGTTQVSGDAMALAHADAMRIVEIAKTYGVPEGALFGHWMMESRGLREGWKDDSNRWVLASSLAHPESECSTKQNPTICAERWKMLRALCNQQVDGRPMCDPKEVRTTYLMAMGPLQHMPNVVLRPRPEGGYVWASQAVDHDGDGYRNPFDPDDALAWTALEIKKHHDRFAAKGEANPWRAAVIRYSGHGNTPYYEGRVVDGKPKTGVRHYWTAWTECRKTGDCPAVIARLRTR